MSKIETRALAGLIVSGAVLLTTACGGGGQGGAPQQGMGGNMQQPAAGGMQQQGGAPHTMTDVQGGWKRIAINGTSTSFEMPAPVDAQQSETGMLRYVSKQGKRSFTVGVSSRQFQQDQKNGVTNDAALDTWADQILQANLRTFEQMKLNPKINLVGKFNVGNSQAIQYSGKVGKADVTYICYVTDLALYYLEVITQNPQSPEVQRFISSFKP